MYKIKVNLKACERLSCLDKFIKINNIKLVLFGEYHGFLKQNLVQRMVVRNISPDFFLYEMLEERKILNNREAKRFLNKPNNEDYSFISNYGQLKPIINLAREFNLPIIGCDLKNMGVSKDWRKIKFSDKRAKEITKKRELQQAKVINRYIKKGLVFVLLGDHHLRKNSSIFLKLQVDKAIVIRPSFKWEERLNNKKNYRDSEIGYIIKLYKKLI